MLSLKPKSKKAVNPISPDHYAKHAIEPWEFVCANATPEELLGFVRYTVFYYVFRAGQKGTVEEDLKKAAWYINSYLNHLETTRR